MLYHENPTNYPKGDAVVVYDLDSTIANTHHRENLAPAENRDLLESWIAYSKGCVNDTPVPGVAETAWMFHMAGYRIHFCSGRNEEAIQETITWLDNSSIPWDEIKLHDEDDPRHNGEHKVAYIENLRSRGFRVSLFFEDHVSVSQTIQEQTGVPVVTVRPWYEDGVGVSFNLGQYAGNNFTELAK